MASGLLATEKQRQVPAQASAHLNPPLLLLLSDSALYYCWYNVFAFLAEDIALDRDVCIGNNCDTIDPFQQARAVILCHLPCFHQGILQICI